jgi:hypothetical protein
MRGPNFTHSRLFLYDFGNTLLDREKSVFVRKYIFGWEKTVCFSNVYFRSARGMEKVGL